MKWILILTLATFTSCVSFHRMKDCKVAMDPFSGEKVETQLQDPDKDFLCRTPHLLFGN